MKEAGVTEPRRYVGGVAQDLDLNGLGFAFRDATVEKAYQVWRADAAIAAAPRTSWMLLVIWTSILPVLSLVVGRPFQELYFSGSATTFMLFGLLYPALFVSSFPAPDFIRPYHSTLNLIGSILIAYIATIQLSLITFGSWELVLLALLLCCAWTPYHRFSNGYAMLNVIGITLPVLLAMEGGEFYSQSTLLQAAVWAAIMGCYAQFLPAAFSFDRQLRQTYIRGVLLERERVRAQKARDLIRRYVPKTVFEHVAAGKAVFEAGPQRRRVTVLFSDIVGFTTMSDRVEAEDVTQVLNEYMSVMADMIDAQGGTLNEFAGDGLMAMFGAPGVMKPKDQALAAARTAMCMQGAMPSLNSKWKELGIGQDLRVRIGINTGVGSVGNFGSQGRMTYTAIGQQINIAARIESKAEPSSILISDSTYQLVCDDIECEPKGEIEVKGVHYPIKVYEVKATA